MQVDLFPFFMIPANSERAYKVITAFFSDQGALPPARLLWGSFRKRRLFALLSAGLDIKPFYHGKQSENTGNGNANRSRTAPLLVGLHVSPEDFFLRGTLLSRNRLAN
jgi:hypothetical protein